MKKATGRKFDDVGPGGVVQLVTPQLHGPLQHSIAKRNAKGAQQLVQGWQIGTTCMHVELSDAGLPVAGCRRVQ